MKIGILTQPLKQNYGGLLQNYALQQVLLGNGYEVKTLDWQYNYQSFRNKTNGWLKTYVLSLFNFCFSKWHFLTKKEQNYLIEELTEFKDSSIILTEKLKNKKEFFKCANDELFDAYIVGSDQCWRPKYNVGFLEIMYLSFLPKWTKSKRIAYAVSFGTDSWEYTMSQTAGCAKLAKLFDLVTVRENTGIKLCKDYLNVDASLVLDPTMLLRINDYTKLMQCCSSVMKKGGLVTYILDKNVILERLLDELAQKNFLHRIELNSKSYNFRNGINLDLYKKISVPDWLSAIYNANITIVDSFHGMVFSILFNKPFWVIGNSKRGMSRFESLLNIFGLENRLIDIKRLGEINIDSPINWNKVNNIIETKRRDSIHMLLNCLNNDKN